MISVVQKISFGGQITKQNLQPKKVSIGSSYIDPQVFDMHSDVMLS